MNVERFNSSPKFGVWLQYVPSEQIFDRQTRERRMRFVFCLHVLPALGKHSPLVSFLSPSHGV